MDKILLIESATKMLFLSSSKRLLYKWVSFCVQQALCSLDATANKHKPLQRQPIDPTVSLFLSTLFSHVCVYWFTLYSLLNAAPSQLVISQCCTYTHDKKS